MGEGEVCFFSHLMCMLLFFSPCPFPHKLEGRGGMGQWERERKGLVIRPLDVSASMLSRNAWAGSRKFCLVVSIDIFL